jgi:hypothetical protein
MAKYMPLLRGACWSWEYLYPAPFMRCMPGAEVLRVRVQLTNKNGMAHTIAGTIASADVVRPTASTRRTLGCLQNG